MKDRETLELQKLDLEVQGLARPLWARPTTWVAVVTVAASLLGMWWQAEAADRARDRAEATNQIARLEVLRAELTLEETRRAIAAARAELEELQRQREDLLARFDGLRTDAQALQAAAGRGDLSARDVQVFNARLEEVYRENEALMHDYQRVRVEEPTLDTRLLESLEPAVTRIRPRGDG